MLQEKEFVAIAIHSLLQHYMMEKQIRKHLDRVFQLQALQDVDLGTKVVDMSSYPYRNHFTNLHDLASNSNEEKIMT